MSVLDYAKLVEPCQRNWLEDETVPQEDIDYILEACTTMPSKQNIPYYSIAYTTDRKIINDIFDVSYYPRDQRNTKGQNTQVRANLLLIWLDNPDFSHNTRVVHEQDTIFSIGISSGAAALAGAEKGYRTGFCKCFIDKGVKKILRPVTGKLFKNTNIRLMLGIGVPDPSLDIRHISIDGTLRGKKDSHGKKEIRLFKL